MHHLSVRLNITVSKVADSARPLIDSCGTELKGDNVRNFILPLVFILAHLGCQEENPYTDGMVKKSTPQGAEDEGTNSGGGQSQNSTAENEESASNEAANEEEIAEESLTVTQSICGDQPTLANHTEEMNLLCQDGKPTVAFVNALEQPYTGDGAPNPTLATSIDNDGVSQFVLIAALKVPSPPEQVEAARTALNQLSFTEGNATVAQTELSLTPSNEAPITETAEIQFDLDVSLGIITVNDRRILTRDFITFDEELGIKGYRTYLTANAPDNEDNIVANQISFSIPNEDNTTTLISVTHQQADNRGQHDTAETTFVNVAGRLMTETMAAIGQ